MAASSKTPQGAPAPSALRDRVRLAMQDEVRAVAFRLFAAQGFEHTTVGQIAQEAGLSRASFFRYFGTKEDVVLGNTDDLGTQVAAALEARPDTESPWQSLRRAFDVLTDIHRNAPEQAMDFMRLLNQADALKARHRDKRHQWQPMLVPETSRRLGIDPAAVDDPRALALVAAALGCLDAATDVWMTCEGVTDLAVILDRAMSALMP
ncbi:MULTISPECIES: TetR family transcriptional regulator [unclassified Streptomyces]|uniref:TetR/AcrR family transcriptional regulator n=1 Tax=unclassified Streptomyces TaxID=2593676 RepID=UPI0033B29BD9